MSQKPDFASMTVNERLLAAGLRDAWASATFARNRDRMIVVLGKVELGDQANAIADTVLANPERFGL